ncbi:hypothetical protein CYLTODRAFT_375033 [Cylindrobasidium torrendii FP15055 ss-10]|uniref:Mini-chromosome maintenance complex-binding protein n=1 Tax=Cylindrobasidium torrendii FP15055 ss-10 TaxID=1314674 RepID=A0A0D7BCJ3_9AGAR|nr:hypothetical protein CYLTODRAFT_375033 [Cylindrobasidium torrendii FP15055 ss-10]
MVSALPTDAISDPILALKDLHKKNKDDAAFPDRVASHFSGIFASPVALEEIPVLNFDKPPEAHRPNALVRFTAMIQDTSISPEVYLSKLADGSLGGWGIGDDNGNQDVNYHDLKECIVVWAVTVPGESPAIPESERSSQAHKYPIPGAKHIGVKVKLYDSAAESFKATDVVTFVGVLSSEPLHIELDESSSTLVPTLHVLFANTAPAPTPGAVDASLRPKIISWLATEALGGDETAAEWVLLSCLARVQSRVPPILPHTLSVTRFPASPSPDAVPALSRALSLLFPYVNTIPLTIKSINETPFTPESKNEILHSGWLQQPKGSICVVSDTGMKEGTLNEAGLLNLHRMQEMMTGQKLEYVFPFSTFSFETDVDFVLLCEGSKSAFFQNTILCPLKTESKSLYGDVTSPPEVDAFRNYVRTAKARNIAISDDAAQHIQEDYVKQRQAKKGMTSDDFIHLMTLARLVTTSYGEQDISADMWEKTKALEAARKGRL